jgi:hypothetical protein
MKKIGQILVKAIGVSSSGFVDSVGKLIDNLTLSNEEKDSIKKAIQKEINRHNEKIKELANSELEALIADNFNASQNNTNIQESVNATLIAKNFPYFLDAIMVISFFIGLVMIMFKIVPKENKELFYTGFGLLGGYVSTVINYHRGSSVGSKDSAETIRHIAIKNKIL